MITPWVHIGIADLDVSIRVRCEGGSLIEEIRCNGELIETPWNDSFISFIEKADKLVKH